MTPLQTKGIVLQATPFKEADQILTVFTPQGIIKLIFKGALSKKQGRGVLTIPLQEAEFVYTKHQSELYRCREISLLNPFAKIRSRLDVLESAGAMGAALLQTQHGHGETSLLYQLFVRFLERLAEVNNPRLISACFQMKLLRHDGVLNLHHRCAECGTFLESLNISRGECYCANHVLSPTVSFNHAESLLLIECTHGKSLSRLDELNADSLFLHKVSQVFQNGASG